MEVKILIAEDEMIERKVMRKFIETTFGTSFTVIEAENGRRAVELTMIHQPDIIFMDIKMPGLDGLQAIEKIRAFNQKVKFIILSAYDSFEYAKRAMKEGVKEYILKPAAKEETIQAILRVYHEIKEERKREKREKESRELAKQFLLREVIEYNVDEKTKSLYEELFPDYQHGFFLAIELPEKENREPVHLNVQQWLDAEAIIEKQNHQVIVFLLTQKKLDKADMLTMARRVYLANQRKLWIGMGNQYSQLEDFPKSYQEALRALEQLKEHAHARYGFSYPEGKSLEQWQQSIMNQLLNNHPKQAFMFLQELIENMGTEVLQELLFRIRTDLADTGLNIDHVNIRNIDSILDWESFFRRVCLELQNYFQSNRYVHRAKEYILNNYGRPITLEEVAEKINLSPPYLSSLFKIETGQSFIEYVTKIRMEKAMELLRSQKYSIKEICFIVGYKDPNYFSRVFKKYTNMPPRDYQKAILKK